MAIFAGGVVGEFDPSIVTQVNLEVQADSVGPWTNPTLVYVDAIWSSNGLVNRCYEDTLFVVRSRSVQVVDSTLTWLDALP